MWIAILVEFMLIISYAQSYGQSSNLDNTDINEVITLDKVPISLAVDPDAEKVYVANRTKHSIGY